MLLNGSKALLNMLTVQLAWELRDTAIKVNTVNPGYTATDLSSTRTAAEGAVEVVRQCLLSADALTGGSSKRMASSPGKGARPNAGSGSPMCGAL
ncbi:MAG: SDR family NAD(P)-dependent oxidoreductase [Janthinobacterium lividum]